MAEEKKKDGLEPLQAFSFMVEVIVKPKSEKLFIVRVSGPQGQPLVATMGSRKELTQFIDGL